MNRKRAMGAFAAAMLAVVALSCAAPRRELDIPLLLWPSPPERPRVKFLDIVVGSFDVSRQRQAKFDEVFFGEAAEVPFNKPMFIALHNGTMFVSDVDRIHVYDFPNKKYGTVGRGFFRNASGIAVASDRTIYIADSANSAVFVFGYGAKKVERLDDFGDLSTPGGIALDEKNDRLYVADAKRHSVVVYSIKEKKRLSEIGGRGKDSGELNYPYDVAVGPGGEIYVVDAGNFRVQIFDRKGKFLRNFGDVGALAGMFSRPKGIAVDSLGHIYVIDSGFANFQIFDPLGNVFLSVGSNGASPGQFTLPLGISIDENDRIYVVDQMNRRIQVFELLKYPDDEPAPSPTGATPPSP